MNATRCKNPLVSLLLALACFVSGGAVVLADSSEQVLILRNGRVLSGRVAGLGDTYLVRMGDKGEVRLPAAAVEMVCRDLEDAYQQRRARVQFGRLSEHLELAKWCHGAGLLARAADQILVVYSLDPEHPGLVAAVRSLELADQASASLEQGTARSRPSPTQPTSRTTLASTVDRETNDTDSGEPDADAESALPPGALEQFTSNVQPLLLNRCAANACHGKVTIENEPLENHFRLARPLPGRGVTRRLTQRNLAGVVPFVNRQAPELSPLLVVPSQPHGGLEEPILTDEQASQFAAIARWVGSLAINQRRKVPSTLREPPGVLSQAGERWRKSESSNPSDAPNATGAPGDTKRRYDRDVSSQPQTSQAQATDSYQPRDPFDPEVFNRRWLDD